MIRLQYIASSGNTYDLNKNGILTRDANFHSWAWQASGVALQYGQRLVQFTKDSVTYSAALVLKGPQIHRRELIERLHEDMERDIRTKSPGRLYWQNWYIPCYAIESTTDPQESRTDNTVGFFCPRPFWVHEESYSFYPGTDTPAEYLDYPYDYPYDFYAGRDGDETIARNFPFASEFKMDIFGPVASPSIWINGHEYGLESTIADGEYATIDSRNNTVTLTTSNGTENIFDFRIKQSNTFAPIPGGTIDIQWSGLFGFDLTLFEERSEPLRSTGFRQNYILVGSNGSEIIGSDDRVIEGVQTW